MKMKNEVAEKRLRELQNEMSRIVTELLEISRFETGNEHSAILMAYCMQCDAMSCVIDVLGGDSKCS